jgi:two-component system chemotaxis response regulator CheB
MAFDLAPDVITLDLEMPEMDGFSFLRLLMNKRPTPVLVVSGYAQRENVFRALELGALDFIAKPSRDVSPDLRNIERDLQEKIELVRKLQVVRLRDRARSLAKSGRSSGEHTAVPVALTTVPSGPPPKAVVAVAASTGGPPAVQQLLCGLPADIPAAILIAQHMPVRFTKAFAERLDRLVAMQVVEATDGQPLCAGTVYIAPGSGNVEVEMAEAHPVVRVVPPGRDPGAPIICPSGDHLFKSLAAQYGPALCAIVLTGMGSDGRDGARTAKAAGATVLVEDPKTAVMPGMPYSVIEAGCVDEVVRIEDLPSAVIRFCASVLSSRP